MQRDATTSHMLGHGGALVESIAFNRRVVGSTPAIVVKYRDLGQVLNSQLSVALRRETPAQYTRAVSGALLSRSGLEEAL